MAHASLDAKAAVLWSYDSLTKGGLDYPHPSGGVANMTGITKEYITRSGRAELCL